MQEKNLNIIPSGDLPVIYASQYDKNRVIRFNLFEGDDEYTLTGTETVKCNIRKNDEHIVVIVPTIGNNTYIDVALTEQACACFGDNIGEITISDDADTLIGTINFILKVERNPIQGGVTSASDIADLETQIEEIIHEVMSDDYYNRDEVDAKLDLKANTADVYTKSEVDTALSSKANAADVYTKTQVDTALGLKADKSDTYTKTQVDTALALKANAADVYTKTEVDEMIEELYPVSTASGAIATFDTSLALPLVSCKAQIVAQQASGTPTPSSPLPISGVSSVNLYRRGVNLWDEDWEVGTINISTGENMIYSGTIRSKGYNPCVGGSQCFVATSKTVVLFYYDKDKNYMQAVSNVSVINNSVTIPQGAYFFRFRMDSAYGMTYNNDISINYPSTDTSYHAYNSQSETKTIALGQTVYGGVLDAKSGKLRVTWGSSDLGSLNWTRDAESVPSNPYFFSQKNITKTSTPNVLCSIYQVSNTSVANMPNYSIKADGNGRIIVINQDYTDASSFKTAMAGIIVVYELATPVEIDITTNNFTTINGEQNIFSDCGDISVSFKQGIQEYIDSKVGG